ncbi:hypothetical protein K2X30_07530 [bacterium]|jgi:hypothetical protein|nr:hypothetical protein [bacterium]
MDFSRRKFPADVASEMKKCSIESIQPYTPMVAPVYVFMKRNQKFVSVKGPLDFFTPEELNKLKVYESFFFTRFIDQIIPYRQAAREVRITVTWNFFEKKSIPAPSPGDLVSGLDAEKVGFDQLHLPQAPPPYEVSDAVIKMIGPLWKKGFTQEPFLLAVFAQELCSPILPQVLLQGRDYNVEALEKGMLLSGWAVFLALHLGYCDIHFLNALRTQAILNSLKDAKMPLDAAAPLEGHFVGDELLSLAQFALAQPEETEFKQILQKRGDHLSLKILSRIGRVEDKLRSNEFAKASIYGPEGFLEVAG